MTTAQGEGSLGARLKAARMARGWSGTRLAREMGYRAAHSMIYQWEREERRPTRKNVAAVAAALGLSIEDLDLTGHVWDVAAPRVSRGVPRARPVGRPSMIGANLTRVMDAKGWSVPRFARALGHKTHRQVWKWRNGRQTPKPPQIRRWSDILEEPYETFDPQRQAYRPGQGAVMGTFEKAIRREERERFIALVEERKWSYAHSVPGLPEAKRRHYCQVCDDILAALEEPKA